MAGEEIAGAGEQSETMFERKTNKVLIGSLLFVIGVAIYEISLIEKIHEFPFLSEGLQCTGVFLSVSVVLGFVNDTLVRKVERPYLLRTLNQTLNPVIETAINKIDCRKCIAHLTNCSPNTVQCELFKELINIDALVRENRAHTFRTYREFSSKMGDCLQRSRKSYHVMPLTRESVRSFYKEHERGIDWNKAQKDWANRNRRSEIKRVVIVDENDLNDERFYEQCRSLINEYLTFSEIIVAYVSRARTALGAAFLPRDFGIFFGEEETTAMFTYVSPSAGQCFLKGAEQEYFTSASEIISPLQRYFEVLWYDKRIRESSEVFLMNFQKEVGTRKQS